MSVVLYRLPTPAGGHGKEGASVTDDIRPDVLDRVRAEYVELTARMQHDVMRLVDDLELNPAEKLRVVADLAGAAVADLRDVGALREPHELLDMNRYEVDLLVERGLRADVVG